MGQRTKKLDPEILKPDDLLTLSELAKLCPGVSEANHCHRGTVHRWSRKGVTINGQVLKLHVIRMPGGQRLVRWCDYQAFRSECDRLRGQESPRIETPCERKTRSSHAREECERIFREASIKRR